MWWFSVENKEKVNIYTHHAHVALEISVVVILNWRLIQFAFASFCLNFMLFAKRIEIVESSLVIGISWVAGYVTASSRAPFNKISWSVITSINYNNVQLERSSLSERFICFVKNNLSSATFYFNVRYKLKGICLDSTINGGGGELLRNFFFWLKESVL